MRRRQKNKDNDLSNEYEPQYLSYSSSSPSSPFPVSFSPTTTWIAPSLILPNLFLGSLHSLHELKLQDLGITHILSLCPVPSSSLFNTIIHKQIIIRDSTNQNIVQYIDEMCAFISLGSCLVHCSAGASRSPSIVLAYLISCKGYTLKEAYMLVKAQRPQVSPNSGFWNQLIEIEKERHSGVNTLSLDDIDLSSKGD